MEIEAAKTGIKFTKTEQQLLSELVLREHPEVIQNGHNKVLVSPKGVALFDYIKGYEKMIKMRQVSNIRQFDMARALFRKLFPKTYIILLD